MRRPDALDTDLLTRIRSLNTITSLSPQHFNVIFNWLGSFTDDLVVHLLATFVQFDRSTERCYWLNPHITAISPVKVLNVAWATLLSDIFSIVMFTLV